MHYSPQVAMLQAVVCGFMIVFCAVHSWRFDKFETMRFWKIKTRGQALQCIVVYCFLLGLPFFMTQGIIYSAIKYKYGFLPLQYTGSPVPYTFWSQTDQSYIKPLSYLVAISWTLNISIHLQELSYWMHLVTISTTSPSYFASWHFYLFAIGSVVSMAITFAITGTFAGAEPLRLEAATYLYGSLATFTINLGFFHIRRVFPEFLRKWKSQGAAPDLIMRLYTFHVLNTSRLACVMIFVVPLMILSIDGLTTAHPINLKPWAVELCLQIGLIGFACQAILTYMIFQPRNLQKEAGFMQTLQSIPSIASQGQSFAANVSCQREALSYSLSKPAGVHLPSLARINDDMEEKDYVGEMDQNSSVDELAFNNLDNASTINEHKHPYAANKYNRGHARVDSTSSTLESGQGARPLPLQLATHTTPICPR